MIKPTKRKGFNFLRSYFDVLNELENDEDKLNFLLSIINKQFLNESPKGLNFIVNLCYESQRHQIESSVKGWERASETTLGNPPPTHPPTTLRTTPTTDPKEEEEELQLKEKEELKEEEEKEGLVFPFDSNEFKHYWKLWKEYKKKEHKFNYKTLASEQAALKQLGNLSEGNEKIALLTIEQSLANGWKGFFKLDNNGTTNRQRGADPEFLKDLLRKHDTTKA